MVLFATKSVTVKLLPFDNKSEIAVVVDLPEGASLEDTERTLFAAADIARGLPEITSVQSYAGTPAPFNFNGLVRHYYLRERPELGELQVNLAARGDRKRASHDIALDLRQRLKAVSVPAGTSIKVVEVPPGPPVLATLLAEIYGPDAATRRAVTGELKKIFAEVPFIVDIDDSIGEKRPRLRLSIDQDRLEFFGVEQRDVYDTIQTLFGGVSIGYSHRGEDRNPIEIAVRLPKRDLAWTEALASTPVPANTLPGSKTVVELGQVVKATVEEGSPIDLSARRPVCRHGDGGTRRPLRGAALRHARSGTSASTPTTGARCRSLSSACTASRPTSPIRRCCGTANGRSPM